MCAAVGVADGAGRQIFINDLVGPFLQQNQTPDAWDDHLSGLLQAEQARVAHHKGYEVVRLVLRNRQASPSDHCLVIGPGTAPGWIMLEAWAKGRSRQTAEVPGQLVVVAGRANGAYVGPYELGD